MVTFYSFVDETYFSFSTREMYIYMYYTYMRQDILSHVFHTFCLWQEAVAKERQIANRQSSEERQRRQEKEERMNRSR